MPNKKKYDSKESEDRLLLQYIRNYMNKDPRSISEEQKVQYLKEAKTLQEKFMR
jgi:hypothetical protein